MLCYESCASRETPRAQLSGVIRQDSTGSRACSFSPLQRIRVVFRLSSSHSSTRRCTQWTVSFIDYPGIGKRSITCCNVRALWRTGRGIGRADAVLISSTDLLWRSLTSSSLQAAATSSRGCQGRRGGLGFTLYEC